MAERAAVQVGVFVPLAAAVPGAAVAALAAAVAAVPVAAAHDAVAAAAVVVLSRDTIMGQLSPYQLPHYSTITIWPQPGSKLCRPQLFSRHDKAVQNVLQRINIGIGNNLYLYQNEERSIFGGCT